MNIFRIKNYPKFIRETDARLGLFGRIKHRLWLIWLRLTGQIGWTTLEYRGAPIIKDDEETS